jgi:fido (protein-threonine AMPylation protein)
MATSHEKLAASLEELRQAQADGTRVFASSQFSRTARERLVRHGFLQEVMKGWLISTSPSTQPGDTTPWFASFWEFCSRYCEERFGEHWHLSPEQSLLLHAAHTAIPQQVIVHSPAANNNRIDLLFGTSLFALRASGIPAGDLQIKDGVRIYRVEAALVRATKSFFSQNPVEAQVVLTGIREPSDLLSRLLDGEHAVVAGRLAGAFRRLGQAADHDVRQTDPFDREHATAPALRTTSPIVTRLRTLWASARDTILEELPKPPVPSDHDAYLRIVDGLYELDAYHSLSIEGYQVTPDLIDRVATGIWDPERESSDHQGADALAARGYWLAFQRVRETVRRVLVSGGDVQIVRSAHRDWYRELFAPHVAAGLLTPSMLAGYRNQPVFLRGSRHVPPRSELVREAMPALFDLIESEPAPAVRAVLGHWLIGYVHPFPDGNGRIARFVMNALLASGGYPWTVIRVDDRSQYLAALEAASVANDLRPFATFVADQMRRSKRLSKTPASRSRHPARRSRS